VAKGSAHIRRAFIEPHSMSLLFNDEKEIGFVMTSLQPASRAAIRSLWRDEADIAMIMTDVKYDGAFCFSNRRISLVAWMPSMTGI